MLMSIQEERRAMEGEACCCNAYLVVLMEKATEMAADQTAALGAEKEKGW